MGVKCIVPGCKEKVKSKKLHDQHVLAGKMKPQSFSHPILPICYKHEKELNQIINSFKSNFWKEGDIENFIEWNEVEKRDTYTVYGRVKDFGKSDATFTELGDKVFEIKVDRSEGIDVYKKDKWYFFTSIDKIHRNGYAFKLSSIQEEDD
jgi:hypothetical protein